METALRELDPTRDCPLMTEKLVDLVMSFIELYNAPADIYLYSYQRLFMRRIIGSVLEHDGAVITGLCARQSGKSESLACLASALCVFLPALARQFPDDYRLSHFTQGFWIGIFAPKQQQSGIIYERIRRRAEMPDSLTLYQDPDIAICISASRGDQVAWSNGSFVIAQTASDHSNVEGKTFHLVIIDEAQLVSRVKVSKEITPMTAATNGSMVKIGTASIQKGGFLDSITFNLEKEKKSGERNHFEVPYNVVIEEKRKAYEATKKPFHLNYEAWVNGELERLGGNIDNEEFRMNFRLLWQTADLGAINLDDFLDAADESYEANVPCYNTRQVAGLDYGKKRDSTILTIMEVDDKPIFDTRARQPLRDNAIMHGLQTFPVAYYRKRILGWGEFPGRRWNDILGGVVEFLQNYCVDTLVCDATGVGDPLTERMSELLPDIKVVPFVISHVGNDYMYKLYLQEFEAGRIIYPAGPETVNRLEFQQFKHEHEILTKHRAGVYIRCEAPEGEHDDYPDSGALACVASTMPVEVGVESLSNPLFDRQQGSSRNNAGRAERYR
jgi:hypothetical protein